MACNGVGTPRILLNSKSALFPDGLANSSGLVGRNLMFHPYSMIRGIFDDPLDGYRGPGVCIWSQEFYETDQDRGFLRGYTFEIYDGKNYKGQVRVENVREDMCTALILRTEEGQTIQSGDKAATRL